MLTRYTCAWTLALCAPVAAQRPADARDAASITAAYRNDLLLGGVRFHAVERRPALFLLQDEDRDYVVEPRHHALEHLLYAFRKHYAAPLGLKLGPRPLPVLILTDRKLFDQVGKVPDDAVFDPRRNDLVTYWSKRGQTYDRLHVLYREMVRQIAAAHAARPDKAPSDWLGYGIGEHLATRPRRSLLTDRDPEFGVTDLGRAGAVADYAKRPMKWEQRERLSFLHHPLAVTTYASLDDYLKATKATRGSDRAEQFRVYRLCAHATVLFLQKAFRGYFRPKLIELLKAEYAGTRGVAAMRKVFSDGELSAMPRLLRLFARSPAAIIAADLPKGADADAAVAIGGEGALYGGLDATPPAQADVPPPPAGLALASALVDYRRLDLGGAEDRLKGHDGDGAKAVRSAAAALDDEIAAWGRHVAKGGVRLTMPDPDRPGCFVTYGVKSFDDESMKLVLERNGEREVKLWDVPPHLLGESMLKQKLLGDADRKRAVALQIAIYCRSLDDTERKRVERRAKRKDLLERFAFVDRCAPLLDAAAAIAAARADLESAGDPAGVLDKVVAAIRPLPNGAERAWLVEHAFRRLVHDTYGRSPERLPKLAGKVTFLDGGGVRVEYDWKDAAQMRDWIELDANAEGLQLPQLRSWDTNNSEVKVDPREKELHLRSQAVLLHKIQLQGDFKVSTVFGTREVEQEGEIRLSVLGPPLWLFHARKGNTHLLAGWTDMYAFAEGRRRRSKVVRKDALQEVFEIVREYEPLVFERKSDTLFLSGGGEVIAEMDASNVAPVGGILMVQPFVQEKDAEPMGVVGPTVIEGVPHPACLEQGRGAFIARWMAKVR